MICAFAEHLHSMRVKLIKSDCLHKTRVRANLVLQKVDGKLTGYVVTFPSAFLLCFCLLFKRIFLLLATPEGQHNTLSSSVFLSHSSDDKYSTNSAVKFCCFYLNLENEQNRKLAHTERQCPSEYRKPFVCMQIRFLLTACVNKQHLQHFNIFSC